MGLLKKQIVRALQVYSKIKTREEFADFLGIKFYTLNNWHNRNTYDLELLIKKFPEVRVEWLVKGEGEMLKDQSKEQETDFRSMTLKERLSYYITNTNTTTSAIEKKSGLSNGTINKKFDMRPETIEKILTANPDLNRKWLLSGEGDMINPDLFSEVAAEPMPMLAEPEVKFEINDNRNKEHHVLGCEGKIIKVDIDTLKNISLEEYCLGNQLEEFSPALLPDFTFMYQLQSRELEPYMVQGDWVCVLKTTLDEVRFDKAYLVDTLHHGKMIKRIEQMDDGSLLLKLPVRSVKYPTMTLERSEIRNVYEVVSRIQNYNNVIFFESRGVDKILKQNDEFLRFANSALESNNQMLEALKNSLLIVQDAIKVIKKQHDIE